MRDLPLKSDISIKIAIRRKVKKALFRGRKLWPSSNIPNPKINFTKTGKTAGTCSIKPRYHSLDDKFTLNFNLPMARVNGKSYIDRTPIHEMAHLISIHIYGRKGSGHGVCWKQIMSKLGPVGMSIERCHSYKVVHRGPTFTYKCPCKTHYLLRTRHLRACRGVKYICDVCKQFLIRS